MNRLQQSHGGSNNMVAVALGDAFPSQAEFPLRVIVCAWCRPRERAAFSHGICPRHFQEFKREMQQARSPNLPSAAALTRSPAPVLSQTEFLTLAEANAGTGCPNSKKPNRAQIAAPGRGRCEASQ